MRRRRRPEAPELLHARMWLGIAAGILWLGGVAVSSPALRAAGLAGLVVALALRFLPRRRREAGDGSREDGDPAPPPG